MADIATPVLVIPVDEEVLSAQRQVALQRQRERQLLLAPEAQHERFERVQFFVGGKAKVDPGLAGKRLWHVLDDRPDGKRAQAAVARRAVPRPPGERLHEIELVLHTFVGHALYAGTNGTQGIHRAHHKIILEIAETIRVHQDQAPFPHELGLFEVLPQLRHELVGEERVVVGQRGDECRCDAPVVLGAVTGNAGPAVAAERFVEEDILSLCHEICLGACGQTR